MFHLFFVSNVKPSLQNVKFALLFPLLARSGVLEKKHVHKKIEHRIVDISFSKSGAL